MSVAGRSGIVRGDVLLVLATLSLVAALAYPRLERRAVGERVARAAGHVREVQDAARRYLSERGDWPEGAEEGVVPEALATFLLPDHAFSGPGYTLRWDRWDTVIPPPPVEVQEIDETRIVEGQLPELPPADTTAQPTPTLTSVAGITVVSDDPRILAGLQDAFGAGRSFLRERSWTLVLVREAGA